MKYQTVYKAMMKTAAGPMVPRPVVATPIERWEDAAINKAEDDRDAATYPDLTSLTKYKEDGKTVWRPARYKVGVNSWPLHAYRKDSIQGIVDAVKGVPHETRFSAKAPTWALSGKAKHLQTNQP